MSRHLIAAGLLLACPLAVTAQTRADFDGTTNFALYKTFEVEVAPPINVYGEEDVANTLAENRLRRAVMHEFQARGLEPTDVSPDLTVRVSSRVTERTDLRSYGWGSSLYPYYAWGYPPYGYWGGWGGYGDVMTYRYLVGSVTIDVVDRDTGELVYRGQSSREIGDHLDKAATRTVHKALKKFPIDALDELD